MSSRETPTSERQNFGGYTFSGKTFYFWTQNRVNTVRPCTKHAGQAHPAKGGLHEAEETGRCGPGRRPGAGGLLCLSQVCALQLCYQVPAPATPIQRENAGAPPGLPRYDVSGDGKIDVQELAACFSELGYVTGRKKTTPEEMQLWVDRQLKKADLNGDGEISFAEFVVYYNKFVASSRRQFSDTYEVEKGSIGKGAFATVLRGRRLTGDGGPVAVKKICKTGIEISLLHNEIAIWERFRHPSLLKLLDVFETDTHLRLVTELMTGGELHREILFYIYIEPRFSSSSYTYI